jgi:TM2 domain-containing membrane protein YozV
MDRSSFDPRAPIEFTPINGVLAFLFPGLGHFMAGQQRRGVYIGAGLLGLFLSGVLIGGIDVVDRREDHLWFLAQGILGPVAFATDYVHQNHFKVVDAAGTSKGRPVALRTAIPGEIRDPSTGFFTPAPPKRSPVDPATGEPSQPPPNIKSLGKVNELGTLFCAIAGMMNLIVIIDATFPRARRQAASSGAM